MNKEEVIKTIDERLSQLGLIKIKRDTNDKKKVSYYNPEYMHDSWYND